MIQPAPDEDADRLPFISEDGILVNSGDFDGLTCEQAQKKLQKMAFARRLARPR